jgi:hypothetical protein
MAKKEKTPDDNKYFKNIEQLPMQGAKFEYSPENIAEIIRCRDDIMYFAKNYFYILTEDGRRNIKLFPKQEEILKSFIDNRFNVLLSSRQTGKALAIETPIMTTNGWTTMGELKDGDYVFDELGNPTKILKAHPINYDRNCYEIEFDNGEKIIADEDHRWFTQTRTERKSNRLGSVRTTKQISEKVYTGNNDEPFHRIPICPTIHYSEKELPINPYVLGYWLGDGHSNASRITIGLQDYEETSERLALYETISINLRENCATIGLLRSNDKSYFRHKLLALNLINNKHIPRIYLESSEEQRMELLRGLMDSDGMCDKRKSCGICGVYQQLIIDTQELCRSLGIKTNVRTYIPKIYGKECKRAYRLEFRTTKKVFHLKRKLERLPENLKLLNTVGNNRNHFHYIKKVTPINSVPVRCISVEADSEMFLCGKSFIPTKNSTLMTIMCLHQALFFEDKLICYAANIESTAKELLNKMKIAYEELPNWLKSPLKANNERSMVFENNSKILTAATSDNTFRGLSISLLALDEFAFVDTGIANNFYNAVMPAITSFKKSKVIMVSTPNGAEGLFYETYTNALKGDTSWKANEMHWSHFPGRGEAWKKEMIGLMQNPENWGQEFDNQFHQRGTSAMNAELIKKWISHCQKVEPISVGYGGCLRIYKKYDPTHTYVFGLDTSKGLGQDFHALNILDITDLQHIQQVAVYHNNQIPVNVLTNIVYTLLMEWGEPMIMIESFGPGEACIELLKNLYNYQHIVNYKRPDKTVQPDFFSESGINTKNTTKIEALNNFKYYFEHLQCIELNDLKTVFELQTFSRLANDTYRAANGKNDDLVMSLLWALYILEKDLAEHYLTISSYDENGKVQSLIHNKTNNLLESIFVSREFETNPIYMDNKFNGGIASLESQGWTFV